MFDVIIRVDVRLMGFFDNGQMQEGSLKYSGFSARHQR